jgi:hypothetical protein
MADQLDKSAEKPLEWTDLHSLVPAPNRVFLYGVESQQSLQNPRDRVQVVVELFSIERLHQHGFRPESGGMPLSFESMLAENSSPAHPIPAKRSPNARVPRRILCSCSRPGLPQALRISSRETHLQHRRFGLNRDKVINERIGDLSLVENQDAFSLLPPVGHRLSSSQCSKLTLIAYTN